MEEEEGDISDALMKTSFLLHANIDQLFFSTKRGLSIYRILSKQKQKESRKFRNGFFQL